MARQQVALVRASATESARPEPRLTRSLFIAVATLTGVGCSDPPKHPALVDPCAEATCPGPVLGGVAKQNPGSGGTGGGGNAGGAGGLNSGVVRGTVVDVVDDTFKTSIAYTQPAIVEAQGASQPIVTADWNGIDPFELKGIQTALNVSWLSVRPKNGNANIRTLTPVTPSLVGQIALPLIQTDVIDAMFQGLSTPSTPQSGAGQLVVSFVSNNTSLGVAGVKVTSASAALVAYRLGGTWSTDVAQTDSSGLVLVGNLAVSAFPGTPVTLTIGGVSSGATTFAVAADAVTLAELRLTL